MLDRQQMLIALRRGSRRRGTHHLIFTGRDDYTSARGMVLDSSIDRRLVEDAVPNEPIDPVCDLGQQRGHLGRVLRMAFGELGRDNRP